MSEHTIKMPDVGEGVAEAEIVEWHVKIGDPVREDDVLAAVMTDKATVEIPSSVEGEVTWLGGEVGDTLAVGSPIVRIATGGEAAVADAGEEKDEAPSHDDRPSEPTETEDGAKPPSQEEPEAASKPRTSKPKAEDSKPRQRQPASAGAPRAEGEKPLASPAVRLRAREAGIDLRQVAGSGPAGRITHDDIDTFMARGAQAPAAGLMRRTDVEEVKIVGLRRRIAEKMALAKSRIPHITYVEEIDLTALEELRKKLNADGGKERAKLTLLPFLMRAMVKAIADQPEMNALFDDDAGLVHRHGGVHIGIAAQTDAGLMVPVVRHAEARDLWDCASEAARLAQAARDGTASREELSGSTITITSLGALGGVATTPVINHPEVAIIGVNKMTVRPVWQDGQFVPRTMMNLSSSFDHRVIDGWNAAVFIQRIKSLLETPAMIFIGD